MLRHIIRRKGATMAPRSSAVKDRTSTPKPVPQPGHIILEIPENLDAVPVRRIAEYVPASFTALDPENENDLLVDDDARWYRVTEESLALTTSMGVMQFSIPALLALCARSQGMSDTDLNDVLGLDEEIEGED
jgi:hypothetical protein